MDKTYILSSQIEFGTDYPRISTSDSNIMEIVIVAKVGRFLLKFTLLKATEWVLFRRCALCLKMSSIFCLVKVDSDNDLCLDGDSQPNNNGTRKKRAITINNATEFAVPQDALIALFRANDTWVENFMYKSKNRYLEKIQMTTGGMWYRRVFWNTLMGPSLRKV